MPRALYSSSGEGSENKVVSDRSNREEWQTKEIRSNKQVVPSGQNNKDLDSLGKSVFVQD
jgi:hypothetical protein